MLSIVLDPANIIELGYLNLIDTIAPQIEFERVVQNDVILEFDDGDLSIAISMRMTHTTARVIWSDPEYKSVVNID